MSPLVDGETWGVRAFPSLAGDVCRRSPSPPVVGMFSFPAAPPTTVFGGGTGVLAVVRRHSAGACAAPPGNPGKKRTGETLTGGVGPALVFLDASLFWGGGGVLIKLSPTLHVRTSFAPGSPVNPLLARSSWTCWLVAGLNCDPEPGMSNKTVAWVTPATARNRRWSEALFHA